MPNFKLFIKGGGGYVQSWSSQICHKICCQISNSSFGGGGGGGVCQILNFGEAKSAITIFARFPIFHFMGVGGMSNFGQAKSAIVNSFGGRKGMLNFCLAKSDTKFFLPDFQLFISWGGGGTSNFGQVNFAIKIFTIFLHFVQISSFSLLSQSSEVERNPKMSISFFDDLMAIFSHFG